MAKLPDIEVVFERIDNYDRHDRNVPPGTTTFRWSVKYAGRASAIVDGVRYETDNGTLTISQDVDWEGAPSPCQIHDAVSSAKRIRDELERGISAVHPLRETYQEHDLCDVVGHRGDLRMGVPQVVERRGLDVPEDQEAF